MKHSSPIILGLILITAGVSGALARDDARLRAKVQTLYEKADQALQTKDLDGYMSLFTDDFHNIFLGRDREGTRNLLKDLFDGYIVLRAENTPVDISRSGNWIRVVNEAKIEGKTRNKDWALISQSTSLDLLVQEGNALKFSRATQIDKYRMANVNGQTYKDGQTGFSFSVPPNWEIFPTSAHPTIQGGVFVMAPDGSSAAMLGYVKAVGVNPQQAVEADEAIGKLLSKPGTYRLIRSGSLRVNGHDGYEVEYEFYIAGDRERHRRRVYLVAGDLLYVLCFDAMPFKQWDRVKDGFQFILNSIR